MASRSTAEYNGGKLVTCRGCGATVQSNLHFDLSGYCPRRRKYGPYPARLDDPNYNPNKSYALRRQMKRGDRRS